MYVKDGGEDGELLLTTVYLRETQIKNKDGERLIGRMVILTKMLAKLASQTK